MVRWWCGLLGVVLVVACRGTPETNPIAPRPVHTLETWDIAAGGKTLGRMLLLEIDDPAGKVRFYRVENQAGQWVGYVDSAGRVFSYPPFETREVFRGIYPMQEAVALLFETEAKVEITRHDLPDDAATPPVEATR